MFIQSFVYVLLYLTFREFKYVNSDAEGGGWYMEALVCKLYETMRDNDLGSNVVVRAGGRRHNRKVTPPCPALVLC